MKTFVDGAVVVSLVLCMAGAFAQSSTRDGVRSPKSTDMIADDQLYRSSRILGSPVRDLEEKKIGEIKDMLLDRARGEIAYVVVRFSGKGIPRQNLYAVPWRALEPSGDGKYYILRASAEIIAQAPGFNTRRWPDIHDPRWGEEVDRYWNRAVGRGPFSSDPVASSDTAGTSRASGDGAAGASNAGAGASKR